ncbi:MAG: GCN5-related N-acetyltransferase [Paenibacillus sp.]|nr:GCN5-related N-acetyltransferase [Paenibacillus sp.]
MRFVIRDAHLGDAGPLIELRKQLDDVHAEARPDLFASGYYYDENEIVSLFAAEKSKIIVVGDGQSSRVLAYMVLNTEKAPQSPVFKHPRTFIYINDLCVSAAYRGQGIGKSLMEYAIAYARSMDADGLELNVAEFNKSAIGLYESMGLRTRNRRMELLLNEDAGRSDGDE